MQRGKGLNNGIYSGIKINTNEKGIRVERNAPSQQESVVTKF